MAAQDISLDGKGNRPQTTSIPSRNHCVSWETVSPKSPSNYLSKKSLSTNIAASHNHQKSWPQ